MTTFEHIKFGDGLDVTDEGAGVIRVDGSGGPPGPAGPAGPAGPTGSTGPAGPGVPVGGTAGQVLTKTSGTDYATAWQTPTGGGGGAVATDPIFDAKGDLPVGTGADTAARLPVGTNGQVLSADSTQATGLRWVSQTIEVEF